MPKTSPKTPPKTRPENPPENPSEKPTFSTPFIATCWMLAAMMCFAAMGVFIRMAVENDLHIFEVVFFRNILALLLMLPWVLQRWPDVMQTRRLGLYSVRALVGTVSMICGFTAITLIPLAEVTALSFTAPLFVTLGAALVLGEALRLRRMTALMIGFLGVVIILRPGLEAISTGSVLAILGAVFIALGALILKKLTATERPDTTVAYMVLLQSPLALIPALFVWTWPGAEEMLWLICLAAAGTIGHLFYARAVQLVEVSQLQPVDFVRLPMIAILAFFIFGEEPSIWTWAGGIVIFTSTVYVTHREAMLARRARKAERSRRNEAKAG